MQNIGEEIQSATIASQEGTRKQEKHQKLWRFIILSVIILLLGESWLANKTYR